ncbi:hypothetical protein SK128_022044 [Halocaridina rubra]|uniref:Uncharacterized protein n=1 Tax=Halocaridina rubra TaxID=373956 RepID=A0AAN9A643_HALRR
MSLFKPYSAGAWQYVVLIPITNLSVTSLDITGIVSEVFNLMLGQEGNEWMGCVMSLYGRGFDIEGDDRRARNSQLSRIDMQLTLTNVS